MNYDNFKDFLKFLVGGGNPLVRNQNTYIRGRRRPRTFVLNNFNEAEQTRHSRMLVQIAAGAEGHHGGCRGNGHRRGCRELALHVVARRSLMPAALPLPA